MHDMNMNQSNSSRIRQPLTGRSLQSSSTEGRSKRSKFTNNSLTPSLLLLKEKVNDPLNVKRPFTPEEKVFDAHIQRPPILPKSRYHTLKYVTDIEPEKRKYPLRCPEEWIERNNHGAVPIINEFIDTEEEVLQKKIKASREFIQNNKNQIWKMDRRFLNKTPQEICKIMVEDESNFNQRIEAYKNIARIVNTSSSNLISACLKDDHLNSLGEVTTDPFIMSAMASSRASRIEKMTTILKPALVNADNSFRRGYRHTAEYGNFSEFVGLMNMNKGSALNR